MGVDRVRMMDDEGLRRARLDRRAVFQPPLVAENHVQEVGGLVGGDVALLGDRPADHGVAERHVPDQVADLGEADLVRVEGVLLDLAHVVQERPRDDHVAVDPVLGKAQTQRAAHDREVVLEQPAQERMVVGLGGGCALVGLGGGGGLEQEAFEHRAQARVFDRGDDLAQLGDHLGEGPAGDGQELLGRELLARQDLVARDDELRRVLVQLDLAAQAHVVAILEVDAPRPDDAGNRPLGVGGPEDVEAAVGVLLLELA
ncbi:hypothetical protein D3C86_1161220 [compost metagenome]